MKDTELVNEAIGVLRACYQLNYTGYDTHIDRGNMIEHITSLAKDFYIFKSRIESIADIINYD